MAKKPNRYLKIIEDIFLSRHQRGAAQVEFEREDIIRVAKRLRIRLPKNLGDVVYSFRYRTQLPDTILRRAPKGTEWVIRPAGSGKYRFDAVRGASIRPNQQLAETKVPDATPGVIAMYALTDEQALLARVRYNRLIDIFTGVACYSLQNHLRTQVKELGQVETDEVYVGVDKRGLHYVFPVQAKGGKDVLSIVQIEQDFAMCAARFPALVCRAIAAQFTEGDLIALFEFEMTRGNVRIATERHYRLVPADQMAEEDLRTYARRSD